MGTTAQLAGELATDFNNTHHVAVLLTEEAHSAQSLSLSQRHLTSNHLVVIADREVSNLFNLTLSGLRQALVPREVETQVAFLVEGATLSSLVAEHLVQGSVNDMGTGVCLLTVAAALNINLRHNIGTDVNLALTHNGAVNAQTLHGLLNVLNVNDEAVTGNNTGVSCLATSLRVERSLIQDNLNLVASLSGGNRHAIHQDCAQLSLSTQLGVTGEDGAALVHELTQLGQVSERALLRLSVSLRTVTLLSHQLTESLLVNLHASLSSHLQGQVNREAVGVVQSKRLSTGNRVRAVLLSGSNSLFQTLSTGLNGVQERLLLSVRNAGNTLEVVTHVRESTLHSLARSREQHGQAGLSNAQQTHRTDSAAHQTAQNVAAALVRGGHAISNQHQRGADVVSHHAHTHVILVALVLGGLRAVVLLAGQLRRSVQNRADLVGLVEVLNTLQQHCQALNTQAGIDVLLRQITQNLEVVLTDALATLVLHEHEVPNLNVTVVVSRRAAFLTVGGATVVEDLRVGACRAGLTGGPVVFLHAHTLNTLGGETNGLSPNLERLFVTLVNGDPQTLGIQAKTTLILRGSQQLVSERNRLLLEVITEGEVTSHLEEGTVTRSLTNLFNIQGADALLHAGRAGERRGLTAQEVGNERNHTGDGEHGAGLVRNQRCRRHHSMAAGSEEIDPALGNLL